MKRYSFVSFTVTALAATLGLSIPARPAPVETRIAPSLTNPDIREIDDTKHIVMIDPAATIRNRLLVFLPGSGNRPVASQEFLRTAAAMGFHAIGLMYENKGTVNSQCADHPNPDCYKAVRLEIIEGVDFTPLETINRANSIVGRLTSLLQHLRQTVPHQRWGQYLDDEQNVRWDATIISGHSQGAGHAGMIAKTRAVQRCLMFSGGDWWDIDNKPAAWMYEPGVTPPQRWYGFTHLRDQQMRQGPKWDALGMAQFGEIIFVENASSPTYDYSHTLRSDLPPAGASANYHAAVVMDGATPRDANGAPRYRPVWKYMLAGPLAPMPELKIAQTPEKRVEISWQGNGYLLEKSVSMLAETWSPVAIPPTIDGDRFSIVATPRNSGMFFRLTEATTAPMDVPAVPGKHDQTMEHQGTTRAYQLFIPRSYDPRTPAPLVLCFHGSGQTAPLFSSKHPDLIARCDAEGVVLVFPQSTKHPERDRNSWVTSPLDDRSVDDVSFTLALIAALQSNLSIDGQRIYASGFSNGGVFVQNMAAQTSGVFAAIAAVASGIGWTDHDSNTAIIPQSPTSSMPVMLVNGRQDPTRPWDGDFNADGIAVNSVQDTIDYWSDGDFNADVTKQDANGEITTSVCQDCRHGNKLVVIYVAKMTHIWPDAADDVGFDANNAVISFFGP